MIEDGLSPDQFRPIGLDRFGMVAGRETPARITSRDFQLPAGRWHWRVAANDAEGLLVLAEAEAACPFRVMDEYRPAAAVHLGRHGNLGPRP